MSNPSGGEFTPQKGKRRSQRSFLESLSITKTGSETPHANKNKSNQNGVHFIDSQNGIICSFSVHEMDKTKPLDISDKAVSKSTSCCLENPNPTVFLSPFVVLSLNTEKFIDYNLSQIPGFFDASSAVPLQIKISTIIDAKQEVWDFAVEKKLQQSTILIAFSLIDRLVMLHHIDSDVFNDAIWSVLFISAQINEENQPKKLLEDIFDESSLTKRVFNYIEAIVFLQLNCRMMPSNEEYTSYDQIAKPTFMKKK